MLIPDSDRTGRGFTVLLLSQNGNLLRFGKLEATVFHSRPGWPKTDYVIRLPLNSCLTLGAGIRVESPCPISRIFFL